MYALDARRGISVMRRANARAEPRVIQWLSINSETVTLTNKNAYTKGRVTHSLFFLRVSSTVRGEKRISKKNLLENEYTQTSS